MDIRLDFNHVTLIIQVSATLILFFVVAKFFTKPMREYLQKREAFIKEAFDDVETAKLAVAKQNDELNERLNNLKDETRLMIKEAKTKAQHKANNILEVAKKDADKLIEIAEERNERERSRMLKATQLEIKDVVTQATETLIKKEINEEIHNEVFDEFVKLIGGDYE